MDTLQLVQRLILSYFPYEPTEGQMETCSQLSSFLFDPDPMSAFILRGYAGTGKTSLVSALIQAAPQLKIKTLLMAPTGRAAKVLSGYSHQRAYTIHKKIYMTLTDTSGVTRVTRAINKYSYTLFIVDEASMIGDDILDGKMERRSLLQDLLDFVAEGNHCRLLLIGDTAQLPPVGSMESPALSSEYLQSLSPLNIYESELTEVVRQQQKSGILHNATLLRNKISLMDDFDDVEFPVFDLDNFPDVVKLSGEDLEDVLNEEYSFGGPEETVFVCRSNKRANMFNQAIRNRILYRDELLNTGDHLMVVKNNYHWLDAESEMGFVANGDIVEVLSARNFQELYGFQFVDVTLRFIDYPDEPNLECKIILDTLISDSPSLTYEESNRLFDSVMEDYQDIPNKADRLRAVKSNPYFNALQVKFSYALTCHKTQGGQWPVVFIDQGFLSDEMISKEYLRWLYTAFTRSTRKVYLLNFHDRFFEC